MAQPQTAHSSPLARFFDSDRRLFIVAGAVLLVVMSLWLALTPGGIMGKADAVGYAVCHRIEARSFLFPNGRQLPMCARCSGTFLGVLIGLLAPGLLLGRRRAASFPPLGVLAVMLAFSFFWAFDGTNSFLHLIPNDALPRLYQPTNFLRLLTGTGHGITMGLFILPVVNATLWADPVDTPPVQTVWHLLALYAVGALLMLGILSGVGFILYPLAFLSALGASGILSAINTVVATMILGRDNTAHTLADALPLIFLGIALAFVIIGGMDAMRYAVFGTWDGFVYPGA